MQKIVFAVAAAALLLAGQGMAQIRELRDFPLFADLPHERQDTGLTGEAVDAARRKAEAILLAGNPTCSKPKLRYSSVPLAGALVRGGYEMTETEIWYFECPDVTPVLVEYRKDKAGRASVIEAREFSTFVRDIPLRPLAEARSKTASYKTFPGRSALHEATCFGMFSDSVQKKLVQSVSRYKDTSGRSLRSLCLRLQVCNTIEPELDIAQDISLGDDPTTEENDFMQAVVRWCNRQDKAALIAEEPELAYGLKRLLPLVPGLTDADEQKFKEQRGK